MYDIIGDIHGHADELRTLLHEMGYRETAGVYRHPARLAVFVGDFVDRGPKILEAIELVRNMVLAETAQAVMGNHEFNAIAFQIPNPRKPGAFLRPHTDRNEHQHEQTLIQLGADSTHAPLAEALAWFRTLPMTLELSGIRVVHACWDPEQISIIEQARREFGGVTDEFMASACDPGSQLFLAIEDVLKGKEAPLPPGHSVEDRYGHMRTRIRTRWFEGPGAQTFRSYALPILDELPDIPLSDAAARQCSPYPADAPPVFFGHYWLTDDSPAPLASNVACVDYSVAKGGRLCAYRWDGESALLAEKFVSVPAGT